MGDLRFLPTDLEDKGTGLLVPGGSETLRDYVVASRFTFASQAARCDSLALRTGPKWVALRHLTPQNSKVRLAMMRSPAGAKQPAVDAGRRIHCHDQLARATFQQLIPTHALGMKLESKAAQQHPL